MYEAEERKILLIVKNIYHNLNKKEEYTMSEQGNDYA